MEHEGQPFGGPELLEDDLEREPDALREQRVLLRVRLVHMRHDRVRQPHANGLFAACFAGADHGLEVPKKKVQDYGVPEELENRLEHDAEYREAFEALTPGRKKSYLLHFSGAKQAATRERRIDKCRAKVLEGKGFNER